jgi:hypothetical protein
MGRPIRNVTSTSGKGDTSHRRTFLGAGIAAVFGRAGVNADESTPRLETMTQWLKASPKMRKLALQSCLDRIRAMEPSIHAWVQVLPQKSTGRGSLSEIPFGVKDIIETRGLATEYGSSIYKGRIGTTDAAVIRELRKRGAILLGKTETTAFAYQTPAPTRNPRDLKHTPGGSSSGSAAAGAAGMVPSRLLLWRNRIQAHLWSSLHGRRLTAIAKPGHAWILHAHTKRYVGVVGIVGAFHGLCRGFRFRSARANA